MKLVGLDFGSTTSSAIIAEADLQKAASGKTEFANLRVLYRPEPVFTPFLEDSPEQIDELKLRSLLDGWLSHAGEPLRAGGAIITGLAAIKRNAASIRRLVQSRIGDAVVATAGDPSLESWVAFMGNTAALSVAEPDRPFINIDVGGGTANLALGQAGEVHHTASFWIGARHFQFVPGTYQLKSITPYGQLVLDRLGIRSAVGMILESSEIQAIVGYYVKALELLLEGNNPEGLTQLPYEPSLRPQDPVITWSGGVGELLYSSLASTPLSTTHYGDLGIDLAQAITKSPLLSKNLSTHVPSQRGRATVYGLMLHSTHISGATLYLPKPDQLPLRDIPLLARIPTETTTVGLTRVISMAAKSPNGAAFQLEKTFESVSEIKSFTREFGQALRAAGYPPDRPLLLFVPQNIGKTLGQYITEWGRSDLNLMVIDEVAGRDAHFASLGAFVNGFVPVSFYGSDSWSA